MPDLHLFKQKDNKKSVVHGHCLLSFNTGCCILSNTSKSFLYHRGSTEGGSLDMKHLFKEETKTTSHVLKQ